MAGRRRRASVVAVSDMAAFWPDGVTLLDDVSPATWLGPRLLPWLGSKLGTRVGAIVPTGFPAYVRILHPLGKGPQRPRWKDLCEAGGCVYHPTLQLEGVPRPPNLVLAPGQSYRPTIGKTPAWVRQSLLTDLTGDTRTPGSVFYGIWEGWAVLTRGASGGFAFVADPHPGHPRQQVSLEPLHQVVKGRPRFKLPARAYLLAYGSLDDLPKFPFELSPSFVWPEDQAFCCATEVDFDSTVVGLSEAGAQRLLDDDSLEALPISIEDRLDSDGDTINPPLSRLPPKSTKNRG